MALYDSPAMGVLDADEAELICAAQIDNFLSPCASGCTTVDEAYGLGRGVGRGGRLRARGRQSSQSAADCRSLTGCASRWPRSGL